MSPESKPAPTANLDDVIVIGLSPETSIVMFYLSADL
jgi:hypothetical protein